MDSESVWKQTPYAMNTSSNVNPSSETALLGNSSVNPQNGGAWPTHSLSNSDPSWSNSADPQSSSSSGRRWDSSNSSSLISENSWRTVNRQDSNSTSGWGSPTSDPCPMAGTEGWGQQQTPSAQDTGCVWGPRDAMGDTKSACTTQKAEGRTDIWGHQELGWNAPPTCDSSSGSGSIRQPSGWECGVVTGRQETSSHGSSATSEPSSQKAWTQVTGQGVSMNGSVSSNGDEYSTNAQLARDEMISRAINCHDGWGQTPVRQDTAWDVGNSESPATGLAAMIVKPLPAVEESSTKNAVASSNGTAIWEASKENVQVPFVSCHIPMGAPINGNSSVTGCGNNNLPLWVLPGSIGDRSLPPTRQGVTVADSWVVPGDSQIKPVSGIWNGSLDANSSAGNRPDGICEANIENLGVFGNQRIGMSGSRLASHPPGVLESIENTHSAIGTPWPGSLFVGNKSASETVVSGGAHAWNSSLLANSMLSTSSSTVPLALIKPSMISDPWSNPGVQATMTRSSSATWSDQAKASIWDPISSPKSASCWNDDVKWSAGGQRSNIWGTAIDSNTSTEEKKVDLASFSLAVGDVSSEMSPDERAAKRDGDVDQAVITCDLSNVRGTLSAHNNSPAGVSCEVQGVGVVRPSLAVTNLSFPPPVMSNLQLAANVQQVKTQQLIHHSQMLQHLQQNAAHVPLPPKPGSAPPPPPALVIAIQQLLQLQQLLQRLQIQQATVLNSKVPRPLPVGCDPLAITIAKIRQQIGVLQMQIQAYKRQLSLAGQFDASTSQELAHEFSASLQVRGEPPNGSGLWKSLSAPDSSPAVLSPPHINNDVVQLAAAGIVASEWPGWPGMAARTTSLCNGLSAADNGHRDASSFEIGASQSAELGVTGSSPANLDIEEFIPGKPWQGPSIRSADDNPFVTPGSVSRSGFNQSAVDDMRVMNVLGSKVSTSNPVASTSPTAWVLAEAVRHVAPGRWPRGVGADQEQFGSVASKGAMQRAPPGLVMPAAPWQQSPQQPLFGRGASWNPKPTFKMSNSIVIKNLPAQIDPAIVKMLCQQHGTVQFFSQISTARLALVTFTRSDDALKAQHALHGYVIANTLLAADFVPDAEVGKLVLHFSSDQSASLANLWSLGLGGQAPESSWNIGTAGIGGVAAASGNLWSGNGFSNSVGGH